MIVWPDRLGGLLASAGRAGWLLCAGREVIHAPSVEVSSSTLPSRPSYWPFIGEFRLQ